ncbi:MAG: sulfatase-like hydrolase/transferase [Myxococcota bacterium]|nr:sulfatase-like hydrolase/transferase [Myxococcota bacterium]
MRRPGPLLLCLALATACSATDGRPNVLLIISDDHGWPDYGFMGSDVVKTPNLDALAASGTVFTHGMSTASVCRPALQSLLTGLQPLEFDAHLAAVRGTGERVRPFEEIAHFETLPERLAERGYVSFQGGKHWEGHYREAGFTHGMATGEASGARGLEARSGGDALALGRSTLDPLLDFVDAHAGDPFLVWFAPMLPHLPHDAGPEHLALYEGQGLPAARQRYYANISRLDARVGEVLAYLEQRGLRERTLVVFLADNGWDPRQRPAGAGGGRGKYSAYELGFRTPILVSWPGHLPAGRRSDRLVSSVDLVETLVELTGARPLPAGDRHSLVPLLGGGGSFGRERVLGGTDPSWRARGHPRDHPSELAWFVRTPTWRYLWFPALGREELYRIDRDPLESEDVSARRADEVGRLKRQVEAWLATFDRPATGLPPGRRIRDWVERRRGRAAAPPDP